MAVNNTVINKQEEYDIIISRISNYAFPSDSDFKSEIEKSLETMAAIIQSDEPLQPFIYDIVKEYPDTNTTILKMVNEETETSFMVNC